MPEPQPTILFCNNRANGYGAETSLLEVAGALRGVHPLVMLPTEGPLSERLRERGVPVLVEDVGPRNILESRRSLARFIHIIQENGVDLLHLNKAYSKDFLFLLIARLASWICNIPLVVHVRGAVPLSGRHRMLLRTADRVICVSECTRKEMFGRQSRLALAGPPGNVSVVHNGRSLDAQRYSPRLRAEMRRRFHLGDHDFVVATIGYIDPLKGQDRFLALARSLLNEGAQMTFLIVGDLTNEQNRPYFLKLQREIAELASPNVQLTGFVDSRDILSVVDVVVSLSNTEGLPGVLIEAMAAERVVVATAVGGSPEIVGDERSGYLVGEGDLARMKHILLSLASNPELRRGMGERARARVHALFSADRSAAQLADLYDRLLKWPFRESQLGAVRPGQA